MPGIEIFFIALIAIPVLMAILIIKLSEPEITRSSHAVLPTYWGNYSDASETVHPSLAPIKLHKLAE